MIDALPKSQDGSGGPWVDREDTASPKVVEGGRGESAAAPAAAAPAAKVSQAPMAWIPSLYLAEGLPYVMVMSVSTTMYKNYGLSNTDIASWPSHAVTTS